VPDHAGGRVVVVVPVFERPVTVLEALDSVRAQRRPPDALVVVDDGSGDDTAARVRRWMDRATLGFPACLVTQPNRGVSAARNRGVGRAGAADWIAFLDSDDLWPEDYLEVHTRMVAARPGAIVACCDKEILDVPSGRTRRARRSWVAGDATRAVARRGPPGTSNSLIDAAHFRAVGGFREHLRTAEDLDLMLRLSLRGPWLYVPGTVARYRHRLGETRGEAPSLGHHHADRRRTRAEVLEDFLVEARRHRPDLTTEIRDLVGRQWARAGRQLWGERRAAEAARCFDRALAARPLDLRSRLGRRWLQRTR